MKVLKIIDSVQSLSGLLEEKMPIRTAFKLKKVTDEVVKVSDILDSRKKEVAESLNITSDNPTDEQRNQFMQKLMPYLEEEVELEFEPIYVDDLGDISIEPKTLMQLDWIIK